MSNAQVRHVAQIHLAVLASCTKGDFLKALTYFPFQALAIIIIIIFFAFDLIQTAVTEAARAEAAKLPSLSGWFQKVAVLVALVRRSRLCSTAKAI